MAYGSYDVHRWPICAGFVFRDVAAVENLSVAVSGGETLTAFRIVPRSTEYALLPLVLFSCSTQVMDMEDSRIPSTMSRNRAHIVISRLNKTCTLYVTTYTDAQNLKTNSIAV